MKISLPTLTVPVLAAPALLAVLCLGESGCATAPETPHAWVSYHATIEPAEENGDWHAEEIVFIRNSVAGPARKFGLKKKKEYALSDLIGWKDTTDRCLAWFVNQTTEMKAYYVNARCRDWTSPAAEEQRGTVAVDFVFEKTAPLTEAELKRCETTWQAMCDPLRTRFGGRFNLRQDGARPAH